MASIKKFRHKWYARIQTWDNGVRREKLIPLKTESKVHADSRYYYGYGKMQSKVI